MIEAGEFLEWAEMFGHRSGTPAGPVEEARAAGRDVLLEVDVQGARSVRDRVPDAVMIYLQPPSEKELARRLRARGTEQGPALDERLAEARRELAEAPRFDHVVVNDRVEDALEEVLAIIDGQRKGTE
jgi:guanylate kinase